MSPYEHLEPGQQAIKGLSRLLERIAPWLADVGTWVFGGLIALNLVVIAALLTVGPVDRAVLVATAAFACALPLEVAGMMLLRLGKDMDDIRLEETTLRSFEEARFPDIRAHFPAPRDRKAMKHRRVRITLAYVLAIAAVSFALTVTGILASLWHMAPWVAVAALVAVVLGAVVILVCVAHAMPHEARQTRANGARSSGSRD